MSEQQVEKIRSRLESESNAFRMNLAQKFQVKGRGGRIGVADLIELIIEQVPRNELCNYLEITVIDRLEKRYGKRLSLLASLAGLIAFGITVYQLRPSLEERIEKKNLSKQEIALSLPFEMAGPLQVQGLGTDDLELKALAQELTAAKDQTKDDLQIRKLKLLAARVAVMRGDPKLAEDLLESIERSLEVEQLELLGIQADVHYAKEEFDKAIVDYEQLLSSATEFDPFAAYQLANCLARLNKSRKAIEYANQIVEHYRELYVHAKQPAKLKNLVASLNNRGALFLRLQELSSAFDDFDDAIIHHRHDILINGNSEPKAVFLAKLLSNRALARNSDGSEEQAIKDLNEAISLGSASVALPKPLTAMILVNRGLQKKRLGLLEAALIDLESSVATFESLPVNERKENFSGFLNACLNCGNVYGNLQQTKKALGLYNKGIHAGEAIVDVNQTTEFIDVQSKLFESRGVTFMGSGALEKARADLDKAIELLYTFEGENPDAEHMMRLASVHNNRGVVFAQMRNNEKARDEFEIAVGQLPKYTQDLSSDNQALYGKCHADLAFVLSELQFVDEARQSFDSAIDILESRPNRTTIEGKYRLARCYKNRAEFHKSQDCFEEAMGDYERSESVFFELSQGSDRFLLELGDCQLNAALLLQQMKRTPEAWVGFEKVIVSYLGNLDAIRGTQREKALLNILDKTAFHRATAEVQGERDSVSAIAYAKKLCDLTEMKNFNSLATLATAFASNGEFESAVEYVEKSIALAPKLHLEELNRRLNVYKGGLSNSVND